MSKDGGDTNVGLFCSDSPYNEHDLSSLEGVYVYSDKDSEEGSSDPLGMELYHYEPEGLSESVLTESGSDEAEDEADWGLGNTSWYALVANCVRSD